MHTFWRLRTELYLTFFLRNRSSEIFYHIHCYIYITDSSVINSYIGIPFTFNMVDKGHAALLQPQKSLVWATLYDMRD